MTDWRTDKISKRQWLIFEAMQQGANVLMAMEAVASVELSHPDEDWSAPQKTLHEWMTSTE